jgi:signal transduction histidine kinase/CheY-like chemotaxis protein
MIAAGSEIPGDPSVMHLGIKEVQREGFPLVLPAIVGAAIVLLGLQQLAQESLDVFMPCDLLLGLVFLVWYLHNKSYVVATWTLVIGLVAVDLLLVSWAHVPAALTLLALPVGLAALFAGLPAGLAVAGICTVLLAGAPSALLGSDWLLRGIAVLQVWGTVGLTGLVVRPLVTVAEWSWSSYQRSRTLLDQARDYQAQLKQTLEDLASANVQLARLNEFAQAMRQEAEEARHTKERFVANVSHELRTPLNMVIGFAELISTSPESYASDLPPALLADLQVILRNSRHLSTLIDDVLDLSQIEAGRMAITKERVDFAELVAAVQIAVSPLFAAKGLYLHVDVEQALPPVLCDSTRIREVILNLLSNATRFTEQGGVQLGVSIERGDILVKVADTGPGIAPDALSRLFQPFEQADGSIRRKHGGSGLGLSISRSFVELHGGRMWMESTPGSGSTVFFRLPIGPPDPLQSGSLRWINPEWEFRQRSRPTLAPRPVVRPRLVIMETGDTLTRMLQRYLDGVDLVPVRDFAQAAADLASTPAEGLIINDASLPQVLQRLTVETVAPPGIPTIVCSMPETPDVAQAMGASAYLVKPISQERLLGTLDGLHLRGKTILIVDDEPEALQLFMRMLASTRRGYRLITASNGQEALRILRRQKPALILLDLIMPEMDGFRVLAECSHDSRLKTIPIVVLSAQDPSGHPIVSSGVAVMLGGGLASHQVLACIDAMRTILAPGARHARSEPPGSLPA